MKKTNTKKQIIENPDVKISLDEALFLDSDTKVIPKKKKRKRKSTSKKKPAKKNTTKKETDLNVPTVTLDEIEQISTVQRSDIIDLAKSEAIELKMNAFSDAENIVDNAKLEAIKIKEKAIMKADEIIDNAEKKQEKKSEKLGETVNTQLIRNRFSGGTGTHPLEPV